MIWIKLLKKVIKILNSNASPKQIALGVSFGLLIALCPVFSPQSLILLFLILIINVNLGMAFTTMAFCKIIVLFMDAPAHIIGKMLLVNAQFFKGFWTMLYNAPIVPYTRFNNTVVLGNLVIGLVLFIPVFISSKIFVVYYRENLMEKVQKYKIVKIFKASKIYGWFKRILAG